MACLNSVNTKYLDCRTICIQIHRFFLQRKIAMKKWLVVSHLINLLKPLLSKWSGTTGKCKEMWKKLTSPILMNAYYYYYMKFCTNAMNFLFGAENWVFRFSHKIRACWKCKKNSIPIMNLLIFQCDYFSEMCKIHLRQNARMEWAQRVICSKTMVFFFEKKKTYAWTV